MKRADVLPLSATLLPWKRSSTCWLLRNISAGEQRKPPSQSPAGERKSHKWIASLVIISDIKKGWSHHVPCNVPSGKHRLKEQ